jgi:ABC-type branched-subunit amino acid transport system substrate-binding protein
VRDSNRERSHETPSIAEGEFPQHSEQSFPDKGPVSDQARARRPLDTTPVRDARLARRSWRPRAESELPDDSEQPPLHMPRSLNPEFVREPPLAPRALGRLAALAGLIIAASIGAAIALFVTGKFPSEFNKMLGLSADKTAVVSSPASETLKTPEQLSSPAARPPSASTDPRPIGEDTARAASVRDATERASTIRGATDNEIRLGISAPFTGSAKELGNQMKLGIETAFNLINESGGIHGRQLRLVAADDGYEPTRTGETVKELYEKDQVFGFVGNVGTPTAVVGLPYALERRALFFGAFTGAGLLRRDPPDRYAFNYRASYAEDFPGVLPDYVSLEGYVAGSLLLEGLKRAGRQLDTEKLVEALETVRDFDMGLGTPISFGPTEHQGSHKVWGTQLNENGRYQAIDLE